MRARNAWSRWRKRSPRWRLKRRRERSGPGYDVLLCGVRNVAMQKIALTLSRAAHYLFPERWVMSLAAPVALASRHTCIGQPPVFRPELCEE
ncbi:hypothetical protein DF3PB_1610003 [uncultured Defluviicoccus sp.]|uniref:Uncharacterized protein n=1 Tax=metagenome TaxID=256318 RepID=A0A380TAD3_9ZZZZ|nr:hypothetical protein DF3PB_1610003 [uncultured Defluviicoccus sp.]